MTNTLPPFGEDMAWSLWDHHGEEGLGLTLADPAAGPTDLVVTDVGRPRLFGYAPQKPNGQAILVLAGGGYTQLVIGKEGVEVAQWLTTLGFHAFVLAHRFPNEAFGPSAPIDDAIEAMRTIRARADEIGITGVGVLGLSSGGHLAACLAADYPKQWPAPHSAASGLSYRPDFMIVGYGPISTNAKGRTIIADKPALPPAQKQAMYDVAQPDALMIENPPPTFIVYAANDPVVPAVNAVRLYEAVQSRGGDAELHIFADAPHGFALREPALPVGTWPKLAEAWLRQIGVRIT